MAISLSNETQKLIEEKVRGGAYADADEVVRAGLASLEQQEVLGDFDAGELDRLLAEGEAGGPSLDGDDVLNELARLRAQRGDAQ